MARTGTIIRGVAGSLLLVGAVAVTLPGRPGAAEGAPRSQPVREVFFGESAETACQPGGREFVLEDVHGLYVCVIFSGLSGTYTAQLTFVAPDGNVYQTMTLPFVTVDAPATVAAVEVEGFRYRVRRAGWGRTGEAVIVATLPVAGTYISQHNLSGVWTVKISLNGRPLHADDHFILHSRH